MSMNIKIRRMDCVVLWLLLISGIYSQIFTMKSTKHVIGIDFGSHYSRSAVFQDGKVDILGVFPTPKRANTLSTGSGLSAFNPASVSASQFDFVQLFKSIKFNSEETLQTSISTAVISIPMTFSDSDKHIIYRAGDEANLTISRVIRQYAATVFSYNLADENKNKTQNVAVIDFGGSTFDISILEVQEYSYLLANTSTTDFSGDKINQILVQYYVDLILKRAHYNITQDTFAFTQLISQIEHAKRLLSTELSIDIEIDSDTFSETFLLTRTLFDSLTLNLFSTAMNSIQTTLDTAELTVQQIDKVLLVGGCGKIPLLRTLITDFFKQEPQLYTNTNRSIGVSVTTTAVTTKTITTSIDNPLLQSVTYNTVEKVVSVPIVSNAGKLQSILPPDEASVCGTAFRAYYLANNVNNPEESEIQTISGHPAAFVNGEIVFGNAALEHNKQQHEQKQQEQQETCVATTTTTSIDNTHIKQEQQQNQPNGRYSTPLSPPESTDTIHKDTCSQQDRVDCIPQESAVLLSLGVETAGGVMTRILHRNSFIPSMQSEHFSTVRDDQTSIEIKIYEGERLLTVDNRLIRSIWLTDIPPLPRGQPQIVVTFELDLVGTLVVTVSERIGGAKVQSILLADDRTTNEVEVYRQVEDAEVNVANDLNHLNTVFLSLLRRADKNDESTAIERTMVL